MPWDDLRLLLVAGRAGSLRDIARDLGIDATTVSRRLKALEASLGVALFTRVRGRLDLTDEARLLLRHAEKMHDAELELRAEAHRIRVAPETIVRVSAPPTLARYVLAPAVAALHRRYPGIAIELDVELANVRPERGDADIAIRQGRPNEAADSLLTRKLGSMGYAVYRSASVATPQRWIAYPTRYSHVPEAQWVERALHGAPPALRTNDPSAMSQAVGYGVGLGLLPELLGNSLTNIEPVGPAVLHREVWMLRLADAATGSVMKTVTSWIVDTVSSALAQVSTSR